MKTKPIDDQMSQVIDRADKRHAEKFRQEGIALYHKKHAERERKSKEADKPTESADN